MRYRRRQSATDMDLPPKLIEILRLRVFFEDLGVFFYGNACTFLINLCFRLLKKVRGAKILQS